MYAAPTMSAGVDATNSTVTLINNTFSCGSGLDGARGVAIYVRNTNLVAKNNIIQAIGGQEAVLFEGSGTQDYSYNDVFKNRIVTDTTGINPGPGNIAADPLFVGYFYLGTGSPCLNGRTGIERLEPAVC